MGTTSAIYNVKKADSQDAINPHLDIHVTKKVLFYAVFQLNLTPDIDGYPKTPNDDVRKLFLSLLKAN